MMQPGLLWHPEMFHGRGRRATAFDGWYFKIVDPQERFVRAIIPGVWMDRDPARQYCFIQILDGRTGRTTMHRYPFEQFWASRERFDIVCGHSRFSLSSMHLDIDAPDLRLTGDLRFTPRGGMADPTMGSRGHGSTGLSPISGGLSRCYQRRSPHHRETLIRR